ncbi:poly a -specific ribonuclease/target of egr1 [Anaeramoeba flamelloides]|uniref:Poly a -specific ribonuclease/target of egr1 n=1 Tax=Anaeramoeba flamelloides TaxID=1746091 RepID=A0ABQ8ZAP2_9EUKA|nr:poly a -specific ribonuclease/target of egr1 [Anaeramoeba flamelloides]
MKKAKYSQVYTFRETKVTSNNIKNYEKEIFSLMEVSDFVAFDTEFTGGLGLRNLNSSKPNQRHTALTNFVTRYGMVEFGLSFVQSNRSTPTITTFTFPVLDGKKFLSDTSSLLFLKQNKFDFNYLFENAIIINPSDRYLVENKSKTFSSEYENEESSYDLTPGTILCRIIGNLFVIEKEKRVSWVNPKLPIVGHFVSMDLYLTLRTFITDIDKNWKKFRSFLQKIEIFDTKLISSHWDRNVPNGLQLLFGRILGDLDIKLEMVSNQKYLEKEKSKKSNVKKNEKKGEMEVESKVEEEEKEKEEEESKNENENEKVVEKNEYTTEFEGGHSAGFDSFMTAIVFYFLTDKFDLDEIESFKGSLFGGNRKIFQL